jgi:hypothetical protein
MTNYFISESQQDVRKNLLTFIEKNEVNLSSNPSYDQLSTDYVLYSLSDLPIHIIEQALTLLGLEELKQDFIEFDFRKLESIESKIDKAYRERSVLFHPDKQENSSKNDKEKYENAFIQLQYAKGALLYRANYLKNNYFPKRFGNMRWHQTGFNNIKDGVFVFIVPFSVFMEEYIGAFKKTFKNIVDIIYNSELGIGNKILNVFLDILSEVISSVFRLIGLVLSTVFCLILGGAVLSIGLFKLVTAPFAFIGNLIFSANDEDVKITPDMNTESLTSTDMPCLSGLTPMYTQHVRKDENAENKSKLLCEKLMVECIRVFGEDIDEEIDEIYKIKPCVRSPSVNAYH